MPEKNFLMTIILVIVLLALGFVWYKYFYSTGAAIPVPETGTNIKIDKEFITLANILEKTKIDTAFFDDSLFVNLKKSVPFPEIPENQGRINPFAPLP
ncbi:hypothetical protein HYW53_01540 [Candidatus Giovannonibacteria bacterium]|nr:hypothetical protein [Candidatus Giovannonibacteria bacterium]